MVFMKKGATPSKNQTPQMKKGKKAMQPKEESDDEMDFDDMDDSDDDVDSDEAPQQLQKTPVNKGAKGRQSMSEKKVSFSIPTTPAGKTPKKDNSILVKKQPTPANKGKTAMQEFKGMKGNNQTKKGMQEEDDDDDDDDDEDDDDFDVEEGDEDDLDLDDLEEEGDDDDDDDDDEDEEDDDDDDDDDDEEDDDDDQANIQKKLAMLKQNNVQQNKKTPVKGADKAKKAESPKETTPKKETAQKSSPQKNPPQQVTEELERRRLRDSKMLFIGGLPKDITAEELKALSSDILDVQLPMLNRKHQGKTMFGFLSFKTEAKAESNLKTLQSKKLRGQPMTLDFVGAKSKNKKPTEDTGAVFNLKKLFVSGIPVDTTIDKVAEHFPSAFQITFNQSPVFRTAMINFSDEEEAKAAYESKREVELSGQKLMVLYSRQGGSGVQAKKRKHNRKVAKNSFAGGVNKNSTFAGKNKNNTFGGNPPAKKMKFMKKSAGGDE